MRVRVITDSTSYIPRALRDSLDIRVVRLSSILDGVTYIEEAANYAPFYDALSASRSFPTTSQASVAQMMEAIEAPIAEGDAVVGVFISEKMSGTYSTAQLARDMVLQRHPDASVAIVDGRSNSMELGLAVLAAARCAARGGSRDDAVAAAEDMTLHTRFLFTPLTLEYLRRGGRIGHASALLGNLLQIKPVLTVADGVTDTFAKVRSLAKAQDLIGQTFAADIRDKGGLDEAYVHHIHDEAAGRSFAARISEIAGRAIDLVDIGPVIGAHVGPGTVGLVYSTHGLMRK